MYKLIVGERLMRPPPMFLVLFSALQVSSTHTHYATTLSLLYYVVRRPRSATELHTHFLCVVKIFRRQRCLPVFSTYKWKTLFVLKITSLAQLFNQYHPTYTTPLPTLSSLRYHTTRKELSSELHSSYSQSQRTCNYVKQTKWENHSNFAK